MRKFSLGIARAAVAVRIAPGGGGLLGTGVEELQHGRGDGRARGVALAAAAIGGPVREWRRLGACGITAAAETIRGASRCEMGAGPGSLCRGVACATEPS